MDAPHQADEWVRMRNSDIAQESEAAAWAELPVPTWLDVLDRYPDMAKWIAHAKCIPDEVKLLLAGHPDESVRWMLAMKRRLPPPVRRALVADEDEHVRRRAARFPVSDPNEG